MGNLCTGGPNSIGSLFRPPDLNLPPLLKTAVQVNMPKPKGGWRPRTMPKEAFKAIAGPVAIETTRAFLPTASISPWNRAYEPGQPAASDVF